MVRNEVNKRMPVYRQSKTIEKNEIEAQKLGQRIKQTDEEYKELIKELKKEGIIKGSGLVGGSVVGGSVVGGKKGFKVSQTKKLKKAEHSFVREAEIFREAVKAYQNWKGVSYVEARTKMSKEWKKDKGHKIKSEMKRLGYL